jgi:hypothetical protein
MLLRAYKVVSDYKTLIYILSTPPKRELQSGEARRSKNYHKMGGKGLANRHCIFSPSLGFFFFIFQLTKDFFSLDEKILAVRTPIRRNSNVEVATIGKSQVELADVGNNLGWFEVEVVAGIPYLLKQVNHSVG